MVRSESVRRFKSMTMKHLCCNDAAATSIINASHQLGCLSANLRPCLANEDGSSFKIEIGNREDASGPV